MRLVSLALLVIVISGCTIVHPTPTPESLFVMPKTVTVFTRGVQKFTASPAVPVTWAIPEVGGGSIDASGDYTAPTTTGTFHVVATSTIDTTVSGQAVVTVVPPPVAVTIAPPTASISNCTTVQFVATVANATNPAVRWAVQETGGGTVDSTGLYTAPATDGTWHVTATSVQDQTAVATATVTSKTKVLSVVVTPPTATMTVGATQQFTATVTTTCGASKSSLKVKGAGKR